MEKTALIIIICLAVLYVIAMVVFSIAALPFGLLPLLFLTAMGLFFAKAARDKLGNSEDEKYNDKVEP